MLVSNRKKIGNILFFILAIVLIYIIGGIQEVDATKLVTPTSKFYVNDYANLLTEDTKQYIIQTNQKLEEKTGAQIVVVTVQNLEGMTIEQYANELFRKFGIGDKDKNNGLLLLCSYQDRKFRVEVGYGLEGILNDGKTGRMQDEYIIPYLKKNQFNEGIRNGYTAFLNEVCKEYQVQIETEKVKKGGNISQNAMHFTVYSSLFTGIGIRIYRKRNKTRALILYLVISVIFGSISYFILANMFYIPVYFIVSLIGIFTSGSRYYGGFSSHGGGSGGGGSSGGRRKFKKFLDLMLE